MSAAGYEPAALARIIRDELAAGVYPAAAERQTMFGLFVFNQTVTLASDLTFRGYYIAPMEEVDPVLGRMILVAVKEPGQTGCRGNVAFPLTDLRPVVKVGK